MRLTAEQPPLMGGLKGFFSYCYRFSFSDLFTEFFGMVLGAKARVIVVMVIEWWPPVSLSK